MKNIKLKDLVKEGHDDYKSPETDFKNVVTKLSSWGWNRKDFYKIIDSIVKK